MLNRFHSVVVQVSARVYAGLGIGSDFFSTASDVYELCPPEIIEGQPVKMLDAQVERISGSPFGACHLSEIEVARGGARFVGPTKMYVFRDVTVAKRWVISGCAHEEFIWPQSEWALSAPTYFAQAAFVDSVQGSRYFGHWLRDDCATNLILPTGVPLLRPKRDDWRDEKFYSDVLGLRQAQSIEHARIRELTYIDDLANNSHKLARLQQHRSSVRKKIRPAQTNNIVYVSRGPSARGRVIENETNLIAKLRSHGVKIIIAENLEPAAFLEEILDANLIISAEGSQCAHAIYALRDNAAGLITLQPHDRFYLPHLEWVRLLGFGFGAVVSRPDLGNFWVDPDEVLRTIDLF